MGFHRPDGIFIGYGPAFHCIKDVKATLLDVAPTVLALMGVEPTPDMDGRIIEEAIRPQFLSSYSKAMKVYSPVRKCSSDSVYSLGDEMEITRRLADLGYL
jgi:arylsulfatase A-like enzyme